MNLEKLNSAWHQLKMVNTMEPLNPHDIMAIINSEEPARSRVQRTFMSLVLFVLLTIICQGG